MDEFWSTRNDPNLLIAKWIARICNAATDLASVRLTPNNQQIYNHPFQGIDKSWKPVCDGLVYFPVKVSLNDVLGL